MIERYAVGMKAERRIAKRMGLLVAEVMIWQIRLFALDRPAEVPQVDSDLVGASGDWSRFDERCAVGKTMEHLELRASWCAFVIDCTAAEPGGAVTNRRIAFERILRRMALDTC